MEKSRRAKNFRRALATYGTTEGHLPKLGARFGPVKKEGVGDGRREGSLPIRKGKLAHSYTIKSGLRLMKDNEGEREGKIGVIHKRWSGCHPKMASDDPQTVYCNQK